ncbi:MAG: LPS export ABC transporter permease LptG [Pseudomonadota bacterium]
MRLVTSYLLKTVIAATGLVLLVLLALAGFIEFIGQLDNTGEGSYTTSGAVLYTALRLPLLAVEMLPVATLLGALLGLGALAGNSELIAMRAAGISAPRLAMSVSISGFILAVLGAVLGEYIAPPLDQFARQYRSSARTDNASVGERNTWVRDGQRIFNVEGVNDRFGFGGFYVFEIDEQQRLTRVGTASRADLTSEGDWLLDNYSETTFKADGIEAARDVFAKQGYQVDPDVLGIAALRPGSLSFGGLLAYLRYLEQNKLDSRAYTTELWGRVSNVIAVILMPMLAIGFVFGSLRSTGAGARLLVGVLIGLGYFLASRTLANSGQVFSIDPMLVGLAPAVVLALVTAFAVARVR